jgi:hypothetical protein
MVRISSNNLSKPTLTFTPTLAILINNHATLAKPFYYLKVSQPILIKYMDSYNYLQMMNKRQYLIELEQYHIILQKEKH